MSRPAACANSMARTDRTPAAQEKTIRLSSGRAVGSKDESGCETAPGICPAANSCGSRTSTSTKEPSRSPCLVASRSRSITLGASLMKIPPCDGSLISAYQGGVQSCRGSGERRNPQYPARLDHVRILDRWRISFDDFRVLRAFALPIMLLGNLPEGVTLLDRIHGRDGGGLLNLQLARIDLGDAIGIAEGKDDLLGLFLVGGLPRQFHLVAFHLDSELGGIEPVALNFLLQLLRSRGGGAAAEDLGTGFLDEFEQTHIVLRLPGARRPSWEEDAWASQGFRSGQARKD